MARKRVSIEEREQQEQQRGRGFKGYTDRLSSSQQGAVQPPEQQAAPAVKRKGIYVNLPEELVARRDTIWIGRLSKDPKAEKSQIVAEALQTYLDALEHNGDPFLER